MAFKLRDSNKRVIGNITDVVRTVDGETMITLDTGHTFQFKSNDIYWDKGHNCFINKPYYRGTLNTAHAQEATAMNTAAIKNVIFAPPATIVYWPDGTKTVVKCSEKDIFDPEKGLAMAIAKRCGGNKGSYYKEIQNWVEKSGKKYPGKPYTENSSVENDALKKYIAQAKKSYETALEAAAKGNPANFLSEMGRVSAALSMLELEINK